MRTIAVLIGGALYTPQGMRIGGDRPSDARAVATAHDDYVIDPPSVGGVEEIVAQVKLDIDGVLAR